MKARSMDLGRHLLSRPCKVDLGNNVITLDHPMAFDTGGHPALPQQSGDVGFERAIGRVLLIPLCHEHFQVCDPVPPTASIAIDAVA